MAETEKKEEEKEGLAVEEDPEKTFEALRQKRIGAIRKKIAKLQNERDILSRKAGDTLGNSGDPAPILEESAQKLRLIRDLYQEISEIATEMEKSESQKGDGENELTEL